MRGPLTCSLVGLSIALAGTAVRAGEPESPCPPPHCSAPTVITAPAPKVVVEVPPANVVIQQAVAQPACEERGGFFKRCCWHNCKVPVCMPPVCTMPAMAPMAVQSNYAAPMTMSYAAPMPTSYAAPMAMSYAAPMPTSYAAPMAMSYAAPMPTSYAAPMAMSYAAPMPTSYAAPMAMSYAAPMPTSYAAPAAAFSFQAAPAAAPLSLQVGPSAAVGAQLLSLSVVPSAAPSPSAYGLIVPLGAGGNGSAAPSGAGSGMDVNAALRQLTSQVEVITRAVDKHSEILTDHEKRIRKLEAECLRKKDE